VKVTRINNGIIRIIHNDGSASLPLNSIQKDDYSKLLFEKADAKKQQEELSQIA